MKNKAIAAAVLAAVLFQFGVPAEAAQEDARPGPDPTARISMSFDGIPLTAALKIFSEQSGLNFVTSEEAETKKVTVYLEDVSVEDALDSLIRANNLSYRKKDGSNVFIVYPSDSSTGLETRIFRLKYARISTSPLDVGGKTTIDSLESAASGGETSSSSSSSSEEGSGGGEGESGSGGSGGASSSGAGQVKTKKGVDQLISSLLSKNGKVASDLRTNTLVVTDAPENLAAITRVIREIDVAPAQVMIEVYLMEVRKGLLDDKGIDWGGDNGALATFTAGNRSTRFPFKLFEPDRTAVTAIGDEEAVPIEPAYTLSTVSGTDFRAVLRMITTDTDTRILARPRVLTMNNEAAEIRLVTNAAIGNIVTQSSTEGSSLTTNTAERSEIGINLKITPQINENNSIGLFLEPAVTTVSVSTQFPTTFLDPTTRSIRTMAQIKNHDTLVLGGLVDSDSTQSNRRIPFLGDLPGIGHAFSYKSNDKSNRELLIFITPHVVDSRTNAQGSTDELALKRAYQEFQTDEMDRLMPVVKQEQKYDALASQQKPIVKPVVGPFLEKKMDDALKDWGNPQKKNG